MKIYSLYNSCIASEIELSKILSCNTNEVDFKVYQVSKSPINKNFEWYNRVYFKGNPWLSYATDGFEYCIRFRSTADFKINEKNKEITFYKRKSTNTNTLRHLLIDQVIPLALSLFNKTLFHSSTVKIGKYAVSFQAPSGSGKSTLAAYFSTKNHKLLTDDSLLLEENNNKIYAYPSYPGIRLWPDNINQIFKNSMRSKKVSQFNTKRIIDTNIKFEENSLKPIILKSIYFINIADHTDIVSLSQTEAFSLIIKYIFRLDFKSRTINKIQFEFINKILNNVSLFKLNYEKKYESLEKVYNLVTNQTLN